MTVVLVIIGLLLLFGVWPFTTDSWFGPVAFISGWGFLLGSMFAKRPEVEDD